MRPLLVLLALSAAPETADVKPSMHAALVAVVGVQPYLARPDAFRAPENAAQIRSAIDTLSRVRHGFLQPKGQLTPSGAMATLFSRQVELAGRELAAGRDEAARLRLGSVTQMCLNCHLRQSAKTDFASAARQVERLRLTDLERAQLYATTRQFDDAALLWKKALVAKPANDVEAFEQAQALKLAVAVAVRSKDDPELAIALLEPQRGRRELPGFMARTAASWLDQARAWKAERFVVSNASTAQLVDEAHALISSTRVLGMAGNDDENFLVLTRAAAALDEALRRDPTGPHRAEALYLLGVLGATVDPPVVWQLEAVYLEACARENAGQPIGRTCLERLRERTWLAWQRADVPGEVLVTLGELSALNP